MEDAEVRVEEAAARVGSSLDDTFTLESLLGIGGMAAVYEASDGRERFAIKILHPELTRSARVLERFRREGDVLRAALHPSVPRVHSEGTTADGCPYLVMDLLRGEALEARRRRFGGRLAWPEVVQIAVEVLDVLEAVHARDLLHRDVKPSNIIWLDSGEVRLIDFGIAKVAQEREDFALTRTGALPGSLSFMSPEHAIGVPSDLDSRSDLWSLGATMFLLLSGRPVHESPTAVGVLALSASRKARSLGAVVQGLPSPLVSIVDRALAFDRQKRFASAAAMRRALLTVSSVSPRLAARPKGRRRALAAFATALASALALGSMGMGVTREGRREGTLGRLHGDPRAVEAPQAAAPSESALPARDVASPTPRAAVIVPAPITRPTSAAGVSITAEYTYPSRSARRDATALNDAGSRAGAASPPTAARCDPPFVIDPTTGTRRVKPGC